MIDAVGMESLGAETTMQRMTSAVQSTLSATDRPYALNDAILSCRPGGMVSVPGVYLGSIVPTAMGAFMNKGLVMKTVLHACQQPRCSPAAGTNHAARVFVYDKLRSFRQDKNGMAAVEPRSIADVPV